MAVIEAQALAKRFGDVEAVRGISFALEAGERLAYIGPNGAGKSTSIKMLTGILYPTGGTAHVLGLVPWRERRHLAMRIGTLFGQRSQLWFQLSPRETLALLGRIYRLSRAETATRIATLADLLDAADLLDRPVRTLSLGERMRCELAASVLHEPEILFLDEPTIGLDLIAKSRFRDLVLRLNEERSTTIFLTSHDVSDIEQVARRVIVINHGRLIYDDRVSRMRRELLRTRLIDVRFETAPASIEIDGARLVKLSGPGAKLEVDTEVRSIRAVLDDLLDRYEVADISVTEPPLEDVITHIYGQAPV
ncbi:MAG: viologen exporter family transport system ATP-binding protein [Gaiellaceae bacterium]|nr:viologen exporter family transport system ATP-binding protein [Gaiellaceae bacterium]